MRSLLLLLVLAGCVASEPPSPSTPSTAPPVSAVGEDRTVEGTVAEVDLEPMTYDGDGIVTVEADDGAVVRVLLPARFGICAATYDNNLFSVEVGDPIAVRGAVTEDGAVRPCERDTHYVRTR